MFVVFNARLTFDIKTGSCPNFLRNQALNPFSFFGSPMAYHHHTLLGLPKNILFFSGLVMSLSLLLNDTLRALISVASFTFTLAPLYSFSPAGRYRFTLQEHINAIMQRKRLWR